MSTPTAEITGTSYAGQRATKAMADSKNNPNGYIMVADPYANRKPEYYVGIFNVSKREIKIPRSWAINGIVSIPAREEEELYSKPYIIPDIKALMSMHAGSDEIVPIPTKGELLAQDIVNTNDPYGNWKTYRPLKSETRSSDGNNYYDLGIFWVRLATPDAEPDMDAVEEAIKRMEARYRQLITEANLYYSSGPREQAKICDPHHEAADYFLSADAELNLPWHNVITGGLTSRLKAHAKAKRESQQ